MGEVALGMFTQITDPVGNLGLPCLVALVPVVLLLLLLAAWRSRRARSTFACRRCCLPGRSARCYPWAVVAPILISLGLTDLAAIRVAAIANNATVSYGALGAPIIALAAVTGYPLLALSGSVGTIVGVLALLPPWVLIYLVAGREGLRDGWPLAISGRSATSSANGR
jgi:L-lactate permease